MIDKTMKEILDTARGIYEKTQCGGAGCCGDFNGAMEYVDGAVGEMIQGIVNTLVDRDLTNQLFRVGLNGFGFIVMVCDICGDTFAKNIAGKTLAELFDLRAAHKCKEPLDNGVKITS